MAFCKTDFQSLASTSLVSGSFLAASLLVSSAAIAAPFETCPSKAFLFQKNPAIVYGVNLVSGTNDILQDDVGNLVGETDQGNVNGVGFDDHTDLDGTNQRYIYGFNTTKRKFVKVDSDFKQSALNVAGQPDGNFFVGDVYQHHYYFYRKGSGLYKFNLDATALNVPLYSGF